MITTTDFREYRTKLGYSNQAEFKNFLSGKDVIPGLDWQYIDKLNNRLEDVFIKINNVVDYSISQSNINTFIKETLYDSYNIIKNSSIIYRLNNQGRRPEQVYFNWMRGHLVSEYFKKALSIIFEINIDKIESIGKDDLNNLNIFSRQPTADLQIIHNNIIIRFEMQAGFQGINDIKEHKVREAKHILQEQNIFSYVIHFDLFNGQVAFINISEIEDSDLNWVTRQQMEGQTVFSIDQNYFIWKITESPVKYKEINFD